MEKQFEYFLAEKLGRTVAELRRTISQNEFVEWNRYFAVKAMREEMAMMKVGK